MENIVTLDHFFLDWEEAKGTFWLCVQPHVLNDDENEVVVDWIDNAHDGSGFTYRVATLSEDLDVTPVPFPNNCTVSLTLRDENGVVIPTIDPTTGSTRTSIDNDLSRAFRITDPTDFARVNRKQDPDSAPGIPPQPVFSDPFALGYNMSLRDAREGNIRTEVPADAPPPSAVSERQLRDMLSLAFWGGLRRTIPRGTVEDTNAADWMEVGQSSEGAPITNQHSLCGLLFRLGDKSALDQLSNVRHLDIEVKRDDWPRPKRVEGLATPSSLASIKAFFSGLLDFGEAEQDMRPQLRWDADFANRVYVIDDGDAFVHVKLETNDWFIRPRAQVQVREENLRRLFLLEARDNTEPDPLSIERMELSPFLSFPVQFRIYRAFPEESRAPALIEMVTSEESGSRLDEYLGKHPDVMRWALFFDQDGEVLTQPLELVGVYDFPWDHARRSRSGRTVLFWGELPEGAGGEASPDSILRLPLLNHAGNPVSLMAHRYTPNASAGESVTKWEVDPGLLSEVRDDFDSLLCVAYPRESARFLPQVVATTVWPSEISFEFAQSVSSIEGNVDAVYNDPPEPHNPAEVTPEGEYLSDLVNFNSLNVSYGLNRGAVSLNKLASIEHFNEFSELYPVFQTQDLANEKLEHHYVFRARPPSSIPPAITEAPDFYTNLYSAIEGGRRVGFSLEHTYGARFEGDEEPLISAHFDFPPISPASVSGSAADEIEANDLDVPLFPFLRCELLEDHNGDELLKLSFETGWLQSRLATDPQWSPVFLRAWRSIAELAYSKRIEITANCRVFDFTAGLAAKDSNLLAALKPEKAVQEIFPIYRHTDSLRNLARAFLKGDFSQTEEVVWLTTGSQPRIGDRCHVVEFGLRIVRDESLLPSTPSASSPAPWTLLRPLANLAAEDLFDRDGQRTELVTGETEQFEFWKWIVSLASAEASIEHGYDPNTVDRTSVLRHLLSGDRLENGTDDQEWIAPSGTVIGDQRISLVSACPVGFRPIAVEQTTLGGQSTQLVMRYMQALATTLDCSSRIWRNNWTTANHWRDHFDMIQQQTASIASIIARGAELLHPLPSPLEGGGVDSVVRESILAWNNPSSGLKDALLKHARSKLLVNPGLLSSTKALLYLRLWSEHEDSNGLLPSDFFEVSSSKLIKEESGNQPAVIVTDTRTYREGLGDLSGTQWFGIAEFLDDVRYDNDFELQKLDLFNFEAFLERRLADEVGAPKPPATVMPAKPVYTPAPNKRIPLASRAPISPPVAHFSGEIEQMREDGSVQELQRGQQFDLSDFLSGILQPPVSETSNVVELVARSPSDLGKRNRFNDDLVLSTIFAIRGDEEATQDWREAWTNDRFYVDLEAGAEGSKALDGLERAESVVSYFDRLANSPDPRFMSQLEQTFESGVLSLIESAIRPAPPSTTAFGGRWYARILPSLEIEISEHDSGAAPGPNSPMIEAFAFRSKKPREDTGDQPHLYLLVNRLVKCWSPHRISLEQVRNFGFAPEFVTSVVSRGAVFQPFVSVDLYRDFPPVQLQRRVYTLTELSAELLSSGVIEDQSEAALHDMSLTISHDQNVILAGQYVDAQGQVQSRRLEPLRSSLPSIHVIVAAGSWENVEVDLSPFRYTRAVFDFQWSSARNLQFFRLHSRRASLS